MTIRPALRAALVVSGLTVTAGCGGTATLEAESGATTSSSTSGSSNTSTNGSSNTVVASGQACDPNAEPTTQACCDERGGRMWDAASGSCVWMAVPGPFVPPAMNG